MIWKTPIEDKPPQGLKVLCMRDGDFYVAQRFADFWPSIPFNDSKFRQFLPPDLWSYIDFPDEYTGYIRFGLHDIDHLITCDELEEICPEDYAEFVSSLVDSFDIEKE